jgi:hypothetical protein
MALLAGVILVGAAGASRASDHLDTPTVIANPQADIGDVYAWTSANGRQLNLIMDIVGRTFSDKLQYVFHIDSGRKFGKTTATTSITNLEHDAAPVETQLTDRAGRASFTMPNDGSWLLNGSGPGRCRERAKRTSKRFFQA